MAFYYRATTDGKLSVCGCRWNPGPARWVYVFAWQSKRRWREGHEWWSPMAEATNAGYCGA